MRTIPIRPRSSFGGIDVTIAVRTKDNYYTVHYLSINFVGKIKHILCHFTIYTFEDAELIQFTVIKTPVEAYNTGLLFVISELNDGIIASLNIKKLVKPPLEVIIVGDTSSFRFGCTTTFSDVYYDTIS